MLEELPGDLRGKLQGFAGFVIQTRSIAARAAESVQQGAAEFRAGFAGEQLERQSGLDLGVLQQALPGLF